MREFTEAQLIELQIKEKKRIIRFHETKISVAECHINTNKTKIENLQKKLLEENLK